MIMAKKQNKPTKTCADCIHEIGYAEGWDEPKYALEWLQQPAEEADNG